MKNFSIWDHINKRSIIIVLDAVLPTTFLDRFADYSIEYYRI